MDITDAAQALKSLPKNTHIQKAELGNGEITIHYSGISKQAVERAGWVHLRSTDYYGVASTDIGQGSFFDLGGSW